MGEEEDRNDSCRVYIWQITLISFLSIIFR